MRVTLALCLSLTFALEAWARCDTADPYECLAPYYGEPHAHSGTPDAWRDQENVAPGACGHQYRLPSEACKRAKENGADWLNNSWHDIYMDGWTGPGGGRGRGYSWWTATDTPYVETANGWTGDTIPRNTQGFELPSSPGTFTDNVLEYLWDELNQADVPGEFECTGGIELTRNGFNTAAECIDAATGKPTGLANCGGHGVSVCSDRLPDYPCQKFSGVPGDPDYCEHEGDWYEWARRNRCSTTRAHVCLSPAGDLVNTYNRKARPGGYHYAMDGVEGTPDGSSNRACLSMTPDLEGDETATYPWAVFNKRLLYMNTSGSDQHGRPDLGGGSCLGQQAQPDHFSTAKARTGCWMDGLSSYALVSSLNARRCFWAYRGFPWIKAKVAENTLASRGIPMGSAIQASGGLTSWELDVQASAGARRCEDSPNDGGNACTSDAECDSGAGTCSALRDFTGATIEWVWEDSVTQSCTIGTDCTELSAGVYQLTASLGPSLGMGYARVMLGGEPELIAAAMRLE